jgi:hypothetical protein
MNADYIPFWVMRRRPPTSDKGGEINESVFGCRGWHSPPAGGWGPNRDPLPGGPCGRLQGVAPGRKPVMVACATLEWSREGNMMRVRLSAQDSRIQHVGPFVCVGYMPRQAPARVTGATNLARAIGAANVGAAHRAATPNAWTCLLIGMLAPTSRIRGSRLDR